MSYKPQFLPIPVLLLMLERRWSVLATGWVTAGVLASTSLLIFGTEPGMTLLLH
jgi:hypothetical protein